MPKVDVCDFAECIETKSKSFKTVCRITDMKCLENFQDKTWCKIWKKNQEKIKWLN